MKITNLLLWVQENKAAEKYYKRIGFDSIQSDDEHSVVGLHGFTIDLVTMLWQSTRDEDYTSMYGLKMLTRSMVNL